MMKEEDYLVERFGKQQPFKVPEGYFEDFASQFMEQLPEREAKAAVVRLDAPSRWGKLRHWSVAACLAVALAGAGMWAFKGDSPQASASDANQFASTSYNTAIDQAADYAMIDNGDIYAYVSGN